ncbi:hypothetical protein HYX13_05645 [Candidatus Woesearchaeota archaeon]|nr:hypothetical protein [Candidatus Woesearchaeota archaeon]
MKFNKNLAVIHAYLCGDGYVIKNPETQKHKYYHIGLRNTNAVLLKDFQQKFKVVFNIEPHIVDGRSIIQNKEIYEFLTKEYSYYSYEWSFPKLSIENTAAWLRAFFDCEGWVENQPRKSRLIRLDCCNQSGIISIQQGLLKFKIPSQIRKIPGRNIYRLTISGLNNIKIFQSKINFFHPDKAKRLTEAINSYVSYLWNIPTSKEELLAFLTQKGKIRQSRNELRVLSIKEYNLKNLQKALKGYSIASKLLGPWKSSTCSQYYCLKIKEEDLHGRRTSSTTRRSSARTEANF